MKGKSKYLFVAVLVPLFLLGALPFVFAGGEGEEEQIVLQFWTMQQSDKRVIENQNSVIAEFERLNPNIKIELEVTPYAAYRDKVLVAAKGASGDVVPAQLALRERMACANGSCHGCAVPVRDGGALTYARACVEGPVFPAEVLAW